MKNTLKLLLLIILPGIILPLYAHENWIDSSEQSGKTIIVKIANGHTFPESRIALKDRILTYCRVQTPDKKIIPLQTKQSGTYRQGALPVNKNGAYLITAALKNPPRYFLKSIVVIGNCTTGSLKAGELFEIVPGKCPETHGKSNQIPLQVFYDGKPLATSLSFSIDGKHNFHSNTDRSGQYQLRTKYPGTYLITASYKGKGCSLTFVIK